MRRVYWLMAAELPAQPLWLQAQGYGRFCFVNSDDCLLGVVARHDAHAIRGL
jgi:hypothetical protein